jgi:hypothetical protein
MSQAPENNLDRGETRWRTCFSSVSHSGHKLDMLKSAMQKYARRREYEKMAWCVTEIYLFRRLAESETEIAASAGIITNLINRLTVILDEELLFADWARFVRCRNWLSEFDRSGRMSLAPLLSVCKAITTGRLLRFPSDVRAYWARSTQVTHADADHPRCSALIETGDAKVDDEGIRCAHSFAAALFDRKSPECFHWAHKLLHRADSGATRFRRREFVYIIWRMLLDAASDCEKLTACITAKLESFFVKGRSERHMWLTNSVALVLFREKIDWSDSMLDIQCDVSHEEAESSLASRASLVIDSYAIDMHCSAGRALGRSRKHFAQEGAFVVREDTEFLFPEWRRAYGAGKTAPNKDDPEGGLSTVHLDSVDTSLIELCPQGCKGGPKVVCFKFDGRVWKEGRSSMNLNRDYECVDACKEVFGLRPIGIDRVKCDWHLEKIDSTNPEWTDNWQAVKVEKPVVYARMRVIGDGVMLQHRKHLLDDPQCVAMLLRIALFRGIFRVTDFCLRNVLIDSDGTLVSIDEHDIGKRKSVFGSREKHLIDLINKSGVAADVIADFKADMQTKLVVIREHMLRCGFTGDQFTAVAHNLDTIDAAVAAEGIES